MELPGIRKPDLSTMPQISDRLSFLYLEKCEISRTDSAITATDRNGTVEIPADTLSVLLLGPGTSITHRAIELIGDAGVTLIWTGENGIRYYAAGRALTQSSRYLQKQAMLVSDEKSHMEVVRKMYIMRFPDDDVSGLTLQQLRGREGARIREVYRRESRQWGVPWSGRRYVPDQLGASDTVNQALSIGNNCLYALAHAVISALGCSPGLGFIHVGHALSFVYDIADLYKTEISIPVAFEIASQGTTQVESMTRRRIRDELVRQHLLERMTKDIKTLLDVDDQDEEEIDRPALWNGGGAETPQGVNYGGGDGS